MSSQISKEKKAQIRARYEQALDTYVDKVKQDPYVLAAILGGSLAYYDVGEDSNLDTLVIVKDDADSTELRIFTEEGIVIDGFVIKRSNFKRMIEGALQGARFHSFFSKGKLLFTKDDSIKEYIEESNYFGKKDREIQLLIHYAIAFYFMYKTRKFLYIIGDVYGSYSFYMQLVRELANIEVIKNKKIPLREVIQQALKLNPTFFNQVFIEACDMKKNIGNMDRMIKACETYLDEGMEIAYKPVLDYLADAQDFRTQEEINDYFARITGRGHIDINCRELVRRGWVLEDISTKRLTNRSKPNVDEPAYFYDPEAVKGGEM